MNKNILKASIFAFVFLVCSSASAEMIYVYCHSTDGKPSPVLDDSGKYLRVSAQFHKGTQLCTVDSEAFSALNAKCNGSLKGAPYWSSYYTDYDIVVDDFRSENENVLRKALEALPETIEISIDLFGADQGDELRNWKQRVDAIEALEPVQNFVEYQFGLDFKRSNHEVYSAHSAVSLYKHTRETVTDAKDSIFQKYFQSIEGAIKRDVVEAIGALKLRKNIAVALATLSQTFHANPYNEIALRLQHIDVDLMTSGSTVTNIVRVDGATLILECHMGTTVSVIEESEPKPLAVFESTRKMTMDLSTGELSPDHISITKFIML